MKRIILFVAAALLSTFPAHAADRGRVVGYIAAFKGLDRAIDQGTFENYTQLDLAFVNPTPAGEVLGPNGLACAPDASRAMISDAQLRRLVAAAHQAGAKIVASLGGAVIPACGGDWTKLAAAPLRQKVVASVMEMVDRYGLDGIDIDLEGELMMSIDKAGNYTPLVRELAEPLHVRSKLLTVATASYPGGMAPDASLPYFDVIGVMSYDGVGPTWGPAGGEHSTYAQAETDLRLWLGKGVPAEKLALGVPFYGHGFGNYAESLTLNEIGARFGKRQLTGDVVGQRCGGCSYVTYNGLPTLERKGQLAGAWGAGVMVWEIGQDLPGNVAIRRLNEGYQEGRAYARPH
ncbi:chitinase [Sphingomonas sp. F9_3S_D5_B_2]